MNNSNTNSNTNTNTARNNLLRLFPNSREIVNLTPHPINLHVRGYPAIVNIPPSGTVARVSVNEEEIGFIVPEDNAQGELSASQADVPIISSTFGDVEGLPASQEGTIYLVSGLVLARCAGRGDVFAPGWPVRDEKGHIVGCRALCAAPGV